MQALSLSLPVLINAGLAVVVIVLLVLLLKQRKQLGRLKKSPGSPQGLWGQEDQKRSGNGHMRERFMAIISHELRTPLHSILGFAELLQLERDPVKEDEYIESIQSAGLDLLSTLSNIIDYTFTRDKHMRLAESHFELIDFLDDLGSQAQILAHQKGLTFSLEKNFDIRFLINTDSGHLRTILSNLLMNAIRFTDSGEVTLTVLLEKSASEEKQNLHTVRIEVEDTGIGIPEDEREKIFDPFYQIQYPDHGTRGGIGLGLTVVRQLAELLGAEIKYEERDPGSRFIVTFACEGISGTTHEKKRKVLQMPTASAGRSFYQHNILVAEDNPVNSRLLEILLDDMGHTCKIVRDGKAALQELQEDHYDVLLMDVQMPVMDGETATRKIRNGEAGEQNRRIQIVALTAYALMQDRDRFIASGMDDYLSKPVRVQQLRKVLTRIAREINR